MFLNSNVQNTRPLTGYKNSQFFNDNFLSKDTSNHTEPVLNSTVKYSRPLTGLQGCLLFQ